MTAAELLAIRASVGDAEPPTDAELTALLDTLGAPEQVASHVLGQRLATLLAQPTKVTYDGDTTEDWSGTIVALRLQIAAIDKAVTLAGPLTTTTGYITRPDRR